MRSGEPSRPRPPYVPRLRRGPRDAPAYDLRAEASFQRIRPMAQGRGRVPDGAVVMRVVLVECGGRLPPHLVVDVRFGRRAGQQFVEGRHDAVAPFQPGRYRRVPGPEGEPAQGQFLADPRLGIGRDGAANDRPLEAGRAVELGDEVPAVPVPGQFQGVAPPGVRDPQAGAVGDERLHDVACTELDRAQQRGAARAVGALRPGRRLEEDLHDRVVEGFDHQAECGSAVFVFGVRVGACGRQCVHRLRVAATDGGHEWLHRRSSPAPQAGPGTR